MGSVNLPVVIQFRGKLSLNRETGKLQVKMLVSPKQHHVISEWNNLYTGQYLESLVRRFAGWYVDLDNPLVMNTKGSLRENSIIEVIMTIGNREYKKQYDYDMNMLQQRGRQMGVPLVVEQDNINKKYCIMARELVNRVGY